MKKTICLNLCEIYNSVSSSEDEFQSVIKKIKEQSGYTNFNRICIGSSFCSQYFLHSSKENFINIFKICNTNNIPITLTLPVFSQKDLNNSKEKIKEILTIDNCCINEITVNDYGMMEYFKNSSYNIQMGRLFSKDYRDRRYHSYYSSKTMPRLFSQSFNQIKKEFNITGVEMDITSEIMDMKDAPKDLNISFNFPYCYQTTGNICEIASINKNTSKKFRPNTFCNMECCNNYIKYCNEENKYYYKFGRTVYFKNCDYEILNLDSARFLYSPIKEVMSI